MNREDEGGREVPSTATGKCASEEERCQASPECPCTTADGPLLSLHASEGRSESPASGCLVASASQTASSAEDANWDSLFKKVLSLGLFGGRRRP